ncbi:MAG: transcriptional repressor [Deltaproteobacteria bacterium]|nr:transcriptional repressor [Deltaproteobacteria bacterium]
MLKESILRYKEKGFKLTPQRIAIFEYLDGNTSHPSAEDIYKGVKEKYPTISFATVYNTIQALRDKGEVLELMIDSKRRHYDPNVSPHHHTICMKCNKIGDMFFDFAEKVVLRDEHLSGFEVLSSQINFYGTCGDCL